MQRLLDHFATYENPDRKSPVDFVNYQRGWNIAFRSRLHAVLVECGLLSAISEGRTPDDFAIGVTGSDGRGEKGTTSSAELVFYGMNGFLNIEALRNVCLEAINASVTPDLTCIQASFSDGKPLARHIFDLVDLEFQDASRINAAFYLADDAKPMPSRLTDVSLVEGNATVLDTAKSQLAKAVKGKPGEKVLKSVRAGLNRAARVTGSGKQEYKGRTITHYDIDSGIATFDPDQGERSFKFGPLRLIQGRLNLSLLRALRHSDNLEDAQRLATRYPTNSIDRMGFLQSEGLLRVSYSNLEELMKLYAYFVHGYALSEYLYSINRMRTAEFDPSEMRENLHSVLAIERGFGAET